MRVWVDIESGTYGSNIDNIYTVDIPANELDNMDEEDIVFLAKLTGVPLRMLGCTPKVTEEASHVEKYLNQQGIVP